VKPFERVAARRVAKTATENAARAQRERAPELKHLDDPKPTDRLFPARQTKVLNTVLEETGLKEDREGQSRTAYSLRHTYISMRLLEGADIVKRRAIGTPYRRRIGTPLQCPDQRRGA
jgi:integrase